MRISDWSSDVCSSDLTAAAVGSTITIQAAVAGTPFTISAETTNGGTVDDQTITPTETQENVAAVTEVLATGSIDVTGGTARIGGNTVASIPVDGADKNGRAAGRGRRGQYGEVHVVDV